MAKVKGKTEESNEGVLVKAAKSIGTAAGKLASAAGVQPPGRKTGKLVKKNKSRLPRRQKKAARKAAKPAQ